jgi:hypothetical protein
MTDKEPLDRDSTLRSLCNQLEEIGLRLEGISLRMDLIADALGYRPDITYLIGRVEEIRRSIQKAGGVEG